MLNYSDFIVGLWLIPVVLCIITPLVILFLWSIKRILDDISSSVRRVEGAMTQRGNRTPGDVQPQATA